MIDLTDPKCNPVHLLDLFLRFNANESYGGNQFSYDDLMWWMDNGDYDKENVGNMLIEAWLLGGLIKTISPDQRIYHSVHYIADKVAIKKALTTRKEEDEDQIRGGYRTRC